MKRIVIVTLLTFTFICISNEMYSQPWFTSKVIKGSDIEPKYSIIDNSGSIIILAAFADTIYNPYNLISYGARDLLLIKINNSGQLLWYKRMGSKSADIAGGIAIDNNDNIYVTGNFYGHCKFTATDSLINTGNADVFIAKYNQAGTFQWAKRIGSSSTLQSSFDLKFNYENELIMIGFFKDTLIIGSTISDIDTLLGNSYTSNFIASIDLNGNHLWSKAFLGTNNNTRFRRIDLSQNGYYFGGYYQNNLYLDIDTITSYSINAYDAFIYKTDFNGNGQWVRRIRGQSTENFRTLATDEYDNVYVLGNYNSPSIFVDSTETQTITYTGNAGGYDTYIGKYNRSGILQWFIRKGSTSKDIYNDFVVRNNLIYATGYFAIQIIFNNDTLRSSNALNEDAFVAAFNEIGDPISGVSIQGTGNYNDAGTVVNMDANSHAYVSGYYRSQQIKIGDSTYTSNNVNKSDLFFAIYEQPFQAVITDEQQVSCYGLSDGMLTVTPYFGRPPFTYNWSHNPGLHQPVATDLPAGSYTATIIDANNDTASTTVSVTQPAPLNINAVVTNVSCYDYGDGAIDITVTGGTKTTDYVYNWTSPDGSGIHPLEADQNNLSRGTFYLTVKDDNLCSLSDTFPVLQPDPIRFNGTLVTNVTTPPGGNGAIDLVVTGGTLPYAYTWSGPSGYSSSAEDIDSLDGGLYTITINDTNSCQNDSSFVVNDIDVLIAQVTGITDVTCYGFNNGTATITVYNATLPLDYVWSDAASFMGINDTVHLRTDLTAGPKSVFITDADAKSATVYLQINQPSAGLSIVLDPADLFCNGDSSGSIDCITSGGTLPYQYLWNTGYTGEDLVNIAGGTYSVEVTDGRGCLQNENIVVNEPSAISLSIDQGGIIFCHGSQTGSATANASGGFGSLSFLWDDPGTQITKTATGLFAGNYQVTVTDENSCNITGSILLEEPDVIVINEAIQPVSCFNGTDGSILVMVSGGTPPFFYQWSNGVFGTGISGISNLNTGDYSLILTDGNNCSVSDTFFIPQPDSVYINSILSTDASCFGASDGSLLIGATGGTGQIHYSVDNGQTFQDNNPVIDLGRGDYLVVVRDDNNCATISHTASISQPDAIIIDSQLGVNISCPGANDGSITIVASDGAGGFTYSIDAGQNFVDNGGSFTGLGPLTYEIRVRDDMGCIVNGNSINITEPDMLVTDLGVNISCHGADDGSITIVASDGAGGFTYSIDGGQNFVDNGGSFTGLGPLTYEIRVRDDMGCVVNGNSINIIEPDILVTDTIEVIHIGFGNLTGSISLESTGGTSPILYVIIPDSTTSTSGLFAELDAATYRLFAIDNNNCYSNELNITIRSLSNKLLIYDAFSPFTTPGKNDLWNIGNIHIYPNCSVKIYNSWGNLVFSSEGYAKPWDGKYKDKELPSGTYYYVIDPGEGSAVITGPVNIVY
jgi:gliding motility-associated-like protein